MRAILFKNGVEVRRANYPASDMSLIDFRIKIDNGDNGELIPNPDNYEWKLLVESVRPTIANLERLERVEVDNDVSNVDYPHLKQIDVVYNVIRKSDAEIIELIERAEENANEQMISKNRLKLMMLYMAVVHRKLNGDNISVKMQEILDRGDNYALKLWQNDSTLKAKLQDLTNVDTDTGWEV